MKASGVAPASYMNQLQQQIIECDKKGGSDASIPAGETTADLLAVLASAQTVEELEAIVQQLMGR